MAEGQYVEMGAAGGQAQQVDRTGAQGNYVDVGGAAKAPYFGPPQRDPNEEHALAVVGGFPVSSREVEVGERVVPEFISVEHLEGDEL